MVSLRTVLTAASAGPADLEYAATAERLRRFLMEARCLTGGWGTAPAAPGELVDVRRAAPGLVVLPAPVWSDPGARFLVRPEVAERLDHAAEAMPVDVRLGFWEGLRPLPVQRALWRLGLRFMCAEHPHAAVAAAEAMLERYIARPAGAPPHSTGSAVDVAPVDAYGSVLGPVDPWGRLATASMARALRGAGLAGYELEWWHWSYGDAEWARVNDCAPLEFASPLDFDGPGGGI